MKRLALFKTLGTLVACSLVSACSIETVLLFGNKTDSPIPNGLINLNTYNGATIAIPLTQNFNPSEDSFKECLKTNGVKVTPTSTAQLITDINDLSVIVGTNNTIIISAIPNSSSYTGSAIISYALPVPTALETVIATHPTVYIDEHFEDDELTKANILNSLKLQTPGLNINQLNVTITNLATSDGSAGTYIVSAKPESILYSGSVPNGTYYASGSVNMTLDKNLIAPGETATPTFKYHGTTVSSGITYTCQASDNTNNFTFSTSAGTLLYKTGNTNDFLGGSFTITATYIYSGNTYIATQLIYAQSNVVTGKLVVGNSCIKIGTGNTDSGTATYTVNGAAPSGGTLAWACNGGLNSTKNSEGLTFSNGKITWDGTTPTNGGQYKITATYSGTNIKTSTGEAYVTVVASNQPFITVPNMLITSANPNSGTLVFTINGVTYTPTWTTTGIPADQGLSFASSKLTWNGTTWTAGAIVQVTASYTLNGQTIKATTSIQVEPGGRKNGTITYYTDYATTYNDRFNAWQEGNMCYISGPFNIIAQGWGNASLLSIAGIGRPAAGHWISVVDYSTGNPYYHFQATPVGTNVNIAPWGGYRETPTALYFVTGSWYTGY